jgi:hypothetical protein
MEGKRVSAEELKRVMAEDFDRLAEEIAEAMNTARDGRIIADTEEPVRDANAVFRRHMYEKALSLLQQKQEASPRDKTLRDKGRQSTTHQTIDGRIPIDRTVYWSRKTGTVIPMDRWLGIDTQRYSLGVRLLAEERRYALPVKLTAGLRPGQARPKAFGSGLTNWAARILAASSFASIGDAVAEMSWRPGVGVETLGELGWWIAWPFRKARAPP